MHLCWLRNQDCCYPRNQQSKTTQSLYMWLIKHHSEWLLNVSQSHADTFSLIELTGKRKFLIHCIDWRQGLMDKCIFKSKGFKDRCNDFISKHFIFLTEHEREPATIIKALHLVLRPLKKWNKLPQKKKNNKLSDCCVMFIKALPSAQEKGKIVLLGWFIFMIWKPWCMHISISAR